MLYKVLRKMSSINAVILNRLDKKLELIQRKRQDLRWSSNFADKAYFDHPFIEGSVIRLYNDSVLARWIFDGFESEELEFTRRYLRNGDVFFDVGSNVGIFSIIAGRKVGKEGRVFSFEPSPETFARLRENIDLNRLSNVTALNLGLSDKTEYLQFNISTTGYDAWNSFAALSTDLANESIKVPVTTLEQIMLEMKITKVDLIKIDVEGWEKNVLLGGEAFFRTNSPVIIMEFSEANTFAAGYYVHELYDILVNWGYKWFRYKDGLLIHESKRLHYPYDNLVATKEEYRLFDRLGL